MAVGTEARITNGVERLKITIRGAVQGVGFRPFVYRLATELNIRGWVLNSSRGVFIEAEAHRWILEQFLLRLEQEKPPLAIIQSLEYSFLDAVDYPDFIIRHSDERGVKTVLILPDIATCADCTREIRDVADRRYSYPFTNCTNCGPRFTIIRDLPYDRPNTSMAHFPLCPDCRVEYENPLDRRFHAQPVACAVCGPHLTLWNGASSDYAADDTATIERAAQEVREGHILALKGLGGFLLIVDARNEDAVQRLRRRKNREEKPFAVLYPSLELIKEHCIVSPLEERVLTSPESPIVLLRRRVPPSIPPNGGDERGGICNAVAPRNPTLGVMLPYTPLHDLLMRELGFPVVATSGNRSDEPICIDEDEARARLDGIADIFLVHNRPIVRHCDDSVVRVISTEDYGQELVLRRARGYAPLPVTLKREMPTILAVGPHLKNTIALSVGRQVFVSQHIGDLDTAQACAAFERVIADFIELYDAPPQAIAHDMHPDYHSTHWAKRICKSANEQMNKVTGEQTSDFADLPICRFADLQICAVQHHHAHLAACLAENEVDGAALGVIWDGTGYGADGTIWGGEFLYGDARDFERVAHLRPFRLPGGDAAVKEPRRTALALLWEYFGAEALEWEHLAPVADFSSAERRVLGRMLERDLNCPVTTSAGRLFDAVSALLRLRQRVAYEAQAAMMLEYAVDELEYNAYPVLLVPGVSPSNTFQRPPSVPPEGGDGDSPPLRGGVRGGANEGLILDWGVMLEALLDDLRRGEDIATMAAKFHNALVDGIIAVACKCGAERVALSGGCFQNRILLERAYERLRDAGKHVYIHQRIPPNDGGIALGQVAVAAVRMGCDA